MTLTVQDIIEAQLRGIGVLDSSEAADASMITNAIQANNIMLDSWSAQNLMIRAATEESFPLIVGKGSYTIGVGGEFNTSKPLEITGAYIRDSYGIDHGVEIFSQDQYKSRDDKSFVTGQPEGLYYDPGYAQQKNTKGTIYLYYIPDDAYTLFITQQKMLTEFVNPWDILNLEPMYYKAIKYGGIVEQYYDYRKHSQAIPPTLVGLKSSAMRVIKTVNATQLIIPLDIPGSKREVFNFLDGSDIA